MLLRASSDRERGFSLIELLVVAGIMLILAAIVVPNMTRARVVSNEASAVNTLRILYLAEIQYSTAYNGSYSENLNVLGPPPSGQTAAYTAAGLVDTVLAARQSGQPSTFTKNGYVFTYTPNGTYPNVKTYTVNADPMSRGSTGSRSFFVNHEGVTRYNETAAATATDPPMK